jgi:hypothetical protein
MLRRKQGADSSSPFQIGEQIFVKSCQPALLFLTKRKILGI